MKARLGSARSIVVLALTAAMISACGSAASSGNDGAVGDGASTAGQADASDVCSLLTTDEVQAATGIGVSKSGHGDFDAAHYCQWELEPGTNTEGVSFDRLVAITKYAGASSYDVAAQGASPVEGIGDKAVTIDHSVNALKGGVHFAVAVILHQPGDDDPALLNKEEQVSEELAAKAAERL